MCNVCEYDYIKIVLGLLEDRTPTEVNFTLLAEVLKRFTFWLRKFVIEKIL